jgi:hypothetical protein
MRRSSTTLTMISFPSTEWILIMNLSMNSIELTGDNQQANLVALHFEYSNRILFFLVN